jgi:hypothetical protein
MTALEQQRMKYAINLVQIERHRLPPHHNGWRDIGLHLVNEASRDYADERLRDLGVSTL